MTDVSLIVPAYNAEETLPALLTSVESQDLPPHQYEVLVVDDGSTDASASLVHEHRNVRLLSQSNRGPGAARNLGARHALGKIIVYTDADCRLPPDFLSQHARLHALHPEVDGIAGAVAPATSLPLASAVLADHLCNWFNAHDRLPPRAPEYMWGANMSVNRRVLEAGIRWSEERITGEDVDFCSQMNALGMSLRFFPECFVRHTDRASLSGFLRHQYNWGFHAPFVRGRNPQAAYSFMFPTHLGRATLLSPAVALGYTALVARGWWRYRPLGLLSVLPLILLGKVAYARGVLEGTRVILEKSRRRIADRRTA
ncbi:MAG: glycosyltransferase [Planctomycetota bacterium]